jgi:hypothetical protein
MTDILRDPAWQSIGALVAVAAIGVAIWAVLRRTHRLGFEYRASQVATVSRDFAGDIRILYRGAEVSDVQLALLRIVNIGAQPVRVSDFEGPLRIAFPVGTVISASVDRASPGGLSVGLTCDAQSAGGSSSVSISPLLLNPTDSFTLKLLLTGVTASPTVTGRIANIRTVEALSLTRESQLARITRAVLWTAGLSSMILVIWVPQVFQVAGVLLIWIVALLLGAYSSTWIDRRIDRERLPR